MKRCLELARQGQGKTGLNPLVGSVLVRDGTVLAESFHSGYGNLHSERALLEKYEQKISTKDVLYINLEPCCHVGKTPACTDIILEKGVKTVVYGMKDPNPRVAGKGIALLENAGVNVIGPVLPELCARFNRGFVSVQTQKRPWITLKKAQTSSGAIAHDDKSPLTITSEKQNQWAHQYVRATHDAILVGVETIIHDDPTLTTRVTGTELPSPLRIILDPHARIPKTATVLSKEYGSGTIVVVAKGTDTSHIQGAKIIEVPLVDSVFDWNELWTKLITPSDEYFGIKSIVVEGGAKTWKLFQDVNMVDEELTLIGSV